MFYSNDIKSKNFRVYSVRKNLIASQHPKAQPQYEFITKYQINFNQINNKY